MARVVCYELNEVPWRVIDLYVGRRPKSHLARLLSEGPAQVTTETTDSGELHPWSTWPTMHRGVDNDVHNIRYINQDLAGARATPPLWEILAQAGKTFGIAGCLQSYPPMQKKEASFHIPDTFAPASDTNPSRYSTFQSLNLKLTGENRAVASGLNAADFLHGVGLFRLGLTFRSAAKMMTHLAYERITPLHKTRRATMQAYVAFDVFMDALLRSKPDYAAVFSNHVAGVMHRYWKYAFPEDFDYTLAQSPADRFHSESIVEAMDIFDSQLSRLVAFADRHGYDVIVASSMGQSAVKRGQYFPELIMDAVEPLARALGFSAPVKMNLAMQPDIALEFDTETALSAFSRLLPGLVDTEGSPVLKQRYHPQGRTLNLSLCRGAASARDKALVFRGRRLPIAELGMRLISRDPGTGYHQPRGIMIWRGAHQPKVGLRETFDSRQYAPTILRALGVAPPPYMMPPIMPGTSMQPVLVSVN